MKKIISLFFVLELVMGLFSFTSFAVAPSAEDVAQEQEAVRPGTLLPEAGGAFSVAICQTVMKTVNADVEKAQEVLANPAKSINLAAAPGGVVFGDAILACGIKTGDISLWMVPYYIRYILEFVLGIAGLIAVAGIVYGGFVYLFAGFSSDKETGKKAIMYGLAGMVITMIAWAFVNIVISILTT